MIKYRRFEDLKIFGRKTEPNLEEPRKEGRPSPVRPSKFVPGGVSVCKLQGVVSVVVYASLVRGLTYCAMASVDEEEIVGEEVVEDTPASADTQEDGQDVPNEKPGTLEFTLVVMEEAANAHQHVLDYISEFQKLVHDKALREDDGSFEAACVDVRHVIATSKQMNLSLRMAADEATSEIARDTALEAREKLNKELVSVSQAFEVTVAKYAASLRREEMKALLQGGEDAERITRMGNGKDKTEEEKQREARDAANSFQRVTGMIMESISTMDAANELLDDDENMVRHSDGKLEEYKGEASSANKTLARIRAKEERARYELYAAFAFFLCVVAFVTLRRLPIPWRMLWSAFHGTVRMLWGGNTTETAGTATDDLASASNNPIEYDL